MAKPKTLIKQGKKKSKEQPLEDAEDYLAAGVDHEDAAGKWRAGDAAKSLRFFTKAIEVYSQGLRRYPKNLDLAYNKARVELEIATDSVIAHQLDVPVHNVLEQALASHRYALDIDPQNPDTLFNTATLLETIAEELAKDDDRGSDAIKLLEEALELLARCFSIQEFRFEESQQQQQQQQQSTAEYQTDLLEEPHVTTADSSPTVSSSAAENQWFSVIEPVTVETLIDTLQAQLSVLTTLTSVLADARELPPSPTIPWISETSNSLLEKLNTLAASDSSRSEEILVTRYNLASVLLEASFLHSLIDIATYKSQLSSTFTPQPTTYDPLLAQAQALLLFASALAQSTSPPAAPSPNQPQPPNPAADRWSALTTAISTLASASKLPHLTPSQLALTHALRGDASLHQHSLSRPASSNTSSSPSPSPSEPYPIAQKNAPQLLANAETFYRNATKLYLSPPSSSTSSTSSTVIGASGSDPDAVAAAQTTAFKCTVAQVLQGKKADIGPELGPKVQLGAQRREWVVEQIEGLVEEGMVPEGFGRVLLG